MARVGAGEHRAGRQHGGTQPVRPVLVHRIRAYHEPPVDGGLEEVGYPLWLFSDLARFGRPLGQFEQAPATGVKVAAPECRRPGGFALSVGTEPDDYLSGLLREQVAGRPITDDEVARVLITMAIAGHETTMNAASSLLWLLARDRRQQELLRADVSLAPRFVEEMLRLRTPAQNFARHTSRDVSVAGTAVPADSRVLLSYAAANRDPAAFPAPDEFDVSRASRAHLAFGWGVHQCIGATLARTELKLLLETLVEYPPFALDGEADFHPLQGGIHYGPSRLSLRFDD